MFIASNNIMIFPFYSSQSLEALRPTGQSPQKQNRYKSPVCLPTITNNSAGKDFEDIFVTHIKMLESRPEDALVKLVKL